MKHLLYVQCKPNIRELSGPETKSLIFGFLVYPGVLLYPSFSYILVSLISGFCLFCFGKYGNTSYNAFYVQNAGLFNSY